MNERVQKIIANSGICSRRKAEELIEEGRVKVNGKTISLGDKADLDNDNIWVDRQKVQKIKKVYYMFNKPKGCLTTLSDPSKLRTIFDIVKLDKRVIPVGRLDYNTEGILILTNDGDFANRVMHPRYEIKKTYVAKLDRQLKEEDIEKVNKGIAVEGRVVKAEITPLDKGANIRIHEGRNRIVRKLFDILGYKVLGLKRIKIGRLSLGSIRPGKFRILTKKETDMIFKS